MNQIIYKLILPQAGCLWTNPYLRYAFLFKLTISLYPGKDWGHEFGLPSQVKGSVHLFKLNMTLRLLAVGFINCELDMIKPCFQLQLCLWDLLFPFSCLWHAQSKGWRAEVRSRGKRTQVQDFTELTGNESRHKHEREQVWNFCPDTDSQLDICQLWCIKHSCPSGRWKHNSCNYLKWINFTYFEIPTQAVGYFQVLKYFVLKWKYCCRCKSLNRYF